MFHIDTHSKRARLATRFFTYGVMTVATVVISGICLLLALGYRFDRSAFSFQLGGLVQTITTPPGAQVTIDGADQRYQTPGKSSLAPGQHTVSFQKQGYRPWTKTVPLAAGQLLWLNYARLLPDTIVTSSAHDFPAVAASKASPDHKWLALQLASDKPDFVIANIQDPTKPTLTNLSIPASKYTKVEGQNPQFSLVEWDLGSRYFLVRYQAGTTVEYLRLDRASNDPAQIINITQTFQLAIVDIHFAADNANSLFERDGDALRRIDLGNNSTSSALVTGVHAFTLYGSGTIAFAATRERTPGDPNSRYQTVGIFTGGKERLVKEFPTNDTMVVDYSEYFGHGYLAVSDTTTKQAEMIRDPIQFGSTSNRTFTTLQLSAPAQWLSFSDNGRMLVIQTGNMATTYDLETVASYQFTVQTSTPVTRPFMWMDDFYLMTDAGKTIQLFEFDGSNAREITGAEEGLGAVISDNDEYLVSVGKNSVTQAFQLQHSRLILP